MGDVELIIKNSYLVCCRASEGSKIRKKLVQASGSVRDVGVLGRLIIWRHLKPKILNLFSLGQGWPAVGGRVPKLRIISEKLFCVWKPEVTSTILEIIPLKS